MQISPTISICRDEGQSYIKLWLPWWDDLLFIVAGQLRFAVHFSPTKHKSIGGRFIAKIELMIIVIYLAENTDIVKVLL